MHTLKFPKDDIITQEYALKKREHNVNTHFISMLIDKYIQESIITKYIDI